MTAAAWSPEDRLSIWTVYTRPKDFPHVPFVARRHEITQRGPRPTTDVVTAETLEDVRGKLPPGLVCMARFDEDEPQIVECWL